MQMTSPSPLRLTNKDVFDTLGTACAEGSEISFVPSGMSMYPFIVGGRDTVILSAPRDISKGDIVAARIPPHGECVLHRVYKVYGRKLTLMGDANLEAVEKCTLGDVVAKAVAIVRNGRRVPLSARRERLAAAAWIAMRPARKPILYMVRLWNR